MQSPFRIKPDQPVRTIGAFLGSPVVVQGWIGLPLNQVVFWALFGGLSMKSRPAWPVWKHLLLGAAKMAVLLGSEWCHNISHIMAACAVGKPVDAVRLIFGMPVLIYDAPEHPSITPRQHLIRSAAGPLCSLALLLASKAFQRVTKPGSPAREIADVGAGMNTFIVCAGLTPVPMFDGGPILKWSLAARGFSPEQAAPVITRVNRVVGAGAALAGAVAVKRRRWLPALIFAFIAAMTLAFGMGKAPRED